MKANKQASSLLNGSRYYKITQDKKLAVIVFNGLLRFDWNDQQAISKDLVQNMNFVFIRGIQLLVSIYKQKKEEEKKKQETGIERKQLDWTG